MLDKLLKVWYNVITIKKGGYSMTNRQVGQVFLKKGKGKSLNMTSTGDKLFSYNTVIAEWIDGKLVFNTTKYSRTTSKQTNWLRGYADVLTSKPAPFNAQHLRQYI